jgi:hypothetical protein
MNDRGFRESGRTRGKLHYRDTLRMLSDRLRPMEPDLEFSHRLEELCETMGALELFRNEGGSGEEGGRRGIIIGGAIFSALPFVGVAAYAIRKHLLRRRVVPLGV